MQREEETELWAIFAILSAVFAALTSILAKIGIDGVNSNLATAIRTIVVVIMAWGMQQNIQLQVCLPSVIFCSSNMKYNFSDKLNKHN